MMTTTIMTTVATLSTSEIVVYKQSAVSEPAGIVWLQGMYTAGDEGAVLSRNTGPTGHRGHPVTSAVDPGLHQSPDLNLHLIVVNRISCFQLSSEGWRDRSSSVNTRAVRDVECLPSTCFSKHAQEFTVTPAKVSKYERMFQQVWQSFS